MKKETQIIITVSNLQLNHLTQNLQEVDYKALDHKICSAITEVLDSEDDGLTWRGDKGKGNIAFDIVHVTKEESKTDTHDDNKHVTKKESKTSKHSATYKINKRGKIVK